MKFSFLFLISLYTLSPAQAESIMASSATWRVEENNANGVVFSNTPALCQNGRIIFPGEYSVLDRSRFFFIVIAAKKSGAMISIEYLINAGVCTVTKFSTE